MEPKPATAQFRLPVTVCTPTDLMRLRRQLESLEDYLYQAGKRGEAPVLPKLARGFSDLAELNKFDLLQAEDRKTLDAFLQVLQAKAPVVHVSFSVEPSADFTAKIISWLRQHISPFALVRIGRQPANGGGCIVRTANRQFDFSFRQYLHAHRDKLADGLAAAAKPEPEPSL